MRVACFPRDRLDLIATVCRQGQYFNFAHGCAPAEGVGAGAMRTLSDPPLPVAPPLFKNSVFLDRLTDSYKVIAPSFDQDLQQLIDDNYAPTLSSAAAVRRSSRIVRSCTAPHSRIALTRGTRELPSCVSEYSTLGGTSR